MGMPEILLPYKILQSLCKDIKLVFLIEGTEADPYSAAAWCFESFVPEGGAVIAASDTDIAFGEKSANLVR